MPLLRHLRPVLEYLLQKTVASEQTARERSLERERKRLVNQLDTQDKEAKSAIAQCQSVIMDLKNTIKQLETFVSNRDNRIESLEHERDILQQDIKGMASVNARCLKYIETIRTVEERPTDGNDLQQQLAAIQENPWQAI
jgi:chromosome segregation ATPase